MKKDDPSDKKKDKPFDELTEGESAKIEGIERGWEAANEEWRRLAQIELIWIAKRKQYFNTDDIEERMRTLHPNVYTHDKRAYGGLMGWARKTEVCCITEQITRSVQKSRHRGYAMTWFSIIYRGPDKHKRPRKPKVVDPRQVSMFHFFDDEDEEVTYEQCVIEGKAAVIAEGESRWTQGDLAIIVPKKYGAQTLERFAADIGLEYSTLQGRKNVAKAWPKNLPRGSFSICRELVTHPDRHTVLAREPHMTVEEAREIMRDYKATSNVVN